MHTGRLRIEAAAARPNLLAPCVAAALAQWTGAGRDEVRVAEIDPSLADTRAFCEHYGVALDRSANCVILAARREGRAWFAACVVLATTKADVNGIAKRYLGASKISFAGMDDATRATQMEYGGITPIGLPADWPVLIDDRVAAADEVIVGSGLRRSKLALSGAALARLPNAVVLASLARDVSQGLPDTRSN